MNECVDSNLPGEYYERQEPRRRSGRTLAASSVGEVRRHDPLANRGRGGAWTPPSLNSLCHKSSALPTTKTSKWLTPNLGAHAHGWTDGQTDGWMDDIDGRTQQV